jgi:hypothetical protein
VGPLRTFATILAALSCAGTAAFAQSAKPRTVYVQVAYGSGNPYRHALVIPAGSPLRLARAREDDIQASFLGRVTLSGAYRIDGRGEDVALSFWPDRQSRGRLPHWKDREVPEEMSIANVAAFARAVVPKAQLAKLNAGTLQSVSGRVTIVADGYETSISCDVTSASVRFVSVVKPPVQIAAIDHEEAEC